jgi:hypothetical protein
MADDVSIELWLDRRRMDALERILHESGTDTQTVMQARLKDLYTQYVPAQERTQINERIEAERLAKERRAEESRRISVFHVTEHGDDVYFKTERDGEFLQAVNQLRAYLRKEQSAPPNTFAEMFFDHTGISADEFDAQVATRMENTGKVIGAYDVDFDKREFSAVNIMDGWKTYAMGDVSTAAYHAFRNGLLSDIQRWNIFLEKLDGKEITSAGHLNARSFSFADEITEMDDRLNFYIKTDFDVDAAFDTFVCTAENDDWLNVYANYDMTAGAVCDTLEIDLHRGNGSEEEFSYTLNAAEKEVLLRKMDEYCMAQNGMSLADYSAQCMSEADESPMQSPTL